jgi:hypothetical protein
MTLYPTEAFSKRLIATAGSSRRFFIPIEMRFLAAADIRRLDSLGFGFPVRRGKAAGNTAPASAAIARPSRARSLFSCATMLSRFTNPPSLHPLESIS